MKQDPKSTAYRDRPRAAPPSIPLGRAQLLPPLAIKHHQTLATGLRSRQTTALPHQATGTIPPKELCILMAPAIGQMNDSGQLSALPCGSFTPKARSPWKV